MVNVVKIDASKIASLKRLLLSICVSNPLEITMEKLAKTVGITKPTLYKYITYLGRAKLLHHIVFDAKRFQNLQKPDKLYLNNTNLFNALCINSNIGTVRETFFVSMLYKQHLVNYATKGDFLIDEKYTFEVGGLIIKQFTIGCIEQKIVTRVEQIDMVVEYKNGLFDIVECKYYSDEFVINKSYEKK